MKHKQIHKSIENNLESQLRLQISFKTFKPIYDLIKIRAKDQVHPIMVEVIIYLHDYA